MAISLVLRVSLMLIALSSGILLYAQTSSFRNFTIRDGLASNTVYHLVRDKEGFLWAATDAGVSRYDGIRFENFTMADGLGDNEILKIVEDPLGRIWFLPYNGRLSYFRKGKFYNDQNDPKLRAIDNYSPYFNYFVSNDSSLWLSTLHNGILKIKGDEWVFYNKANGFPTIRASLILQGNGDTILIPRQDYKADTVIENIKIQSLTPVDENTPPWLGRQTKFSNFSNNCYFSISENILWKGNQHQVLDSFPIGFSDNPNSLFWNGHDSVWLHTESYGANLFKIDERGINSRQQFLNGLSTTSCVHFQGQLWISTYRNGLFKLNRFTQLTSFPAKDIGSIYELHLTSPSNSILGISSNGLIMAQKKSWKFIARNFDNITQQKFKAIKPSNEELYVSTQLGVFQFDEPNLSLIFENTSNIFDPSVIKDFTFDKSDLWISANNGIFRKKNGSIQRIKCGKEFDEMGLRSTRIHLNEDTIWIGTTHGLRIGLIEKDSVSKWIASPVVANVSTFSPHFCGNIWVGTNGMGIYIFEHGKLKLHISETNGLQSNYINDIWHENDSSTWVVTNLGLTHFSPDHSNSPFPFEFQNFSHSDGLLPERVRCVKTVQDTLWLGGDEGLASYIFSKRISDEQKIQTVISRIDINGRIYPIDSIPILDYTQNNITISFSGLNPHYTGNIRWRYQIAPGEWVETNQGLLKLASLQPGEYHIKIKSFLLGSSLESEPATLHFTILAPFTQTWPFYFLIGLVGALGMGGVFFWIYKARLNRANLHRKITESRLTALRTQMNPHFIFNSLNSIQNFITHNEKEAAYLYLARFGKLMRRVLDNSDHNMIPLEDEIATLELYCQLEQLRSTNGFDFQFIVQEDIDQEFTLIPPTLIQPIIENAIWHGVMQADHRGMIKISFTLDGQWLTCSIRDNGIGREKAKEIAANRRRHKSKAISITQERLNLLNNSAQQSITLEVIDHKDAGGNPAGTEVILKIPDIGE